MTDNVGLNMKIPVRVNILNTDTKNTQKGTFINNTKTDSIGGETVQERLSLSKALKVLGRTTNATFLRWTNKKIYYPK